MAAKLRPRVILLGRVASRPFPWLRPAAVSFSGLLDGDQRSRIREVEPPKILWSEVALEPLEIVSDLDPRRAVSDVSMKRRSNLGIPVKRPTTEPDGLR